MANSHVIRLSPNYCSKCGGKGDGFKCPKCGSVSTYFDPDHHKKCKKPGAMFRVRCKSCGEVEDNCTCK